MCQNCLLVDSYCAALGFGSGHYFGHDNDLDGELRRYRQCDDQDETALHIHPVLLKKTLTLYVPIEAT